MNFYKHHIGDYDQATRHLSFLEDAAYCRLLRKYFAEEKSICGDIDKVQKLIGARTRAEKDAVVSVLNEFFILESDGWHNKRADEELAKASAQAAANQKTALDREAKKRARLDHEQSTNRGQSNDADSTRNDHESWSGVQHESCSSREPSQTPDSRLSTQDVSNVSGTQPSGTKLPDEPDPPPPIDGTRKGHLCKTLRKLGIDCAPHLEAWTTLLPAHSDEEIIAVAEIARQKNQGKSVHLNYLIPMLRDRAELNFNGGQNHGKGRRNVAAIVAAATGADRRQHSGDDDAIEGTAVRTD